MLFTLIDRLGEWNPQLFRELKGRFTPRSLLIAVSCALIGLLSIFLICSESRCQAYATGRTCLQYGWDIDWRQMFRMLNWMLPLTLLVGGVYQLSNDLAKEEHRGTLNFIRLSPQSSQSILIGKILGVPVLIYLGIGLVLPFHLGAGLASGIPLAWLLGLYTLWGAGCCLLYNLAFFYTLLLSAQNNSISTPNSIAGSGSLIACFLAFPYIGILASSFNWYDKVYQVWQWHWFFLPIGGNLLLVYVWMLMTLSVGNHWIWQAVNRRFRNPNTTLLKKSQSYGLVTCCQLWLLGFVLPGQHSVVLDSRLTLGLSWLFYFTPVLFFLLIAALSPSRQSLLDWSRYRHQTNTEANRSIWQDLVWSEKSPALVAITINLLITAAIWVPWMLLFPEEVWVRQGDLPIQQALLGLFLSANIILIYGAIAQLMLLSKHSKSGFRAAGTVVTLTILPLVVGGGLALEGIKFPLVWVFSPLPILTFIQGSTITALFGLLAQVVILGLLTAQLTRKLQQAGESASKALFVANSPNLD